MSETKFTKGEWEVFISPNMLISIEANHYDEGSFNSICECVNSKPDAHLIAAAPEMYAMLKEVRKLCHSGGYFETRDKIDSVLAKARGESC